MANLRLHARVRRRGDDLVIDIPPHLRDEAIREGDEVSVLVRGTRPLPRRRRP